jgi:hypothetical protein
MRIFRPLVLSSGITLSLFAGAQTAPRLANHPNLNGTWALNVSKSDFGQVPPPLHQSESILQAGEEFAIAITLEREETKQHYTLRFRTGGDAMPLAAGSFPDDAAFRIVSVKGEWDGTTIVVTEKVSYQGADGNLTVRYTLSGGGKVLTKQTHVSMGENGDFDTRTVYDKQ